jgi:hypothetical protein
MILGLALIAIDLKRGASLLKRLHHRCGSDHGATGSAGFAPPGPIQLIGILHAHNRGCRRSSSRQIERTISHAMTSRRHAREFPSLVFSGGLHVENNDQDRACCGHCRGFCQHRIGAGL